MCIRDRLQVGHSHSRAVLIMYFWAALIAFGSVAFSVTNTGRTVVLTLAGLCLVGLVVLLTPRFRPRAPRAVQSFVPPRYRRQSSGPMAELSAKDKQILGEASREGSAERADHGPTGGRR